MTGFATRFGLLRISQVSSVDRSSSYRRSSPPAEGERGAPPPPTVPPPARGSYVARRRRRLLLAAGISILGATLLLLSAFTGWWSLSYSEGNGPTITTTFVPGSEYSVSCSVTGCAGVRSGTSSYGAGDFGAVGTLYGAAQLLLIAAAVLGLLVGVLGLIGLGGRGFPRPVFLFAGFAALLAVVLALGAVVGVTAFQPSALSQDGGGIPATAPSPLSSFWGSCSTNGLANDGICQSEGSGVLVSASWGPGLGWAFAWIGAIVLLFGFVTLLRTGPIRLPTRPGSNP